MSPLSRSLHCFPNISLNLAKGRDELLLASWRQSSFSSSSLNRLGKISARALLNWSFVRMLLGEYPEICLKACWMVLNLIPRVSRNSVTRDDFQSKLLKHWTKSL